MHRLVHLTLLGGLGLSLTAGQIQIGGTSGLTSAYVFGSTSSCAGATATAPTFTSCQVPAGGANIERPYLATLFSSASPTPAVTASPLSGGGATFARDADAGMDIWATSNSITPSTSSDIKVSVGVFGVDKIWTMLNDYWGGNGLVNTTLVFTFDDSSDGLGGLTGPIAETVALTNGQQIRSSVSSSGSTAKTCSASYSGAGVFCSSPGTTIATTLGSSTTIGNATVSAGNVFTSSYTSANGANGSNQYFGTTGSVVLDYQLFDFGSLHTNDYLVSITVKNQLASTQSGTSGINQTRAALSAVTVNQVVPEPGTIILSLAGLGALGYFRRRRKA